MKLYVPLLKSCTSKGSLSQIHAHLLTTGLHGDALLATKLIESYAKMGSIDSSRRVFDDFPTPDSFMWGVMIKSHVWNLDFEEAISLYHHGIRYHWFQSSSFVLTPVLQACSSLYDMPMGRKIQGRLIKDGFESDAVVGTALLQMYGGGGSLEDACRVFNEMPTRDVVSWSLMISSCVQCGQASRGLELFSEMNSENVEEDSVLMLTLADACADVGLLKEAKAVHGHILRRWTETAELMENSLITMYGNCYDLESAEKLFGKASKRSVVSWTAMISSYNQRSCYREALSACAEMLKSNIEPNVVTMMGVLFSCTQLGLLKEGKSVHGFSLRRLDPHLNSLGTALITMYSSFGKLKSCLCVFEEIEKKTVVSWNSLIAACSQNRAPEKTLELFSLMLSKGLLPDSFSLAGTLPACGHIRQISLGRQIHGIANKIGFTASTFVQNSLIDMYCKCGSIDNAFRVFDEIKGKNTVTWNAMIDGLSENGCSEEAIALFEKRHFNQGVDMDTVTYLSAIKACTSLGSLFKGRWIHHKLITSGLENDSRIDAALTNMYAKCGDIEMARQVFDSVPEKNVVLWSSIISGYGSHGLVSDAICLFARMVNSGVSPNNVTFMAILSACCHAGFVEEGLFYFDLMREKFGIEPELEHCVSVVYLLSRAGQIDRAYGYIKLMQVEPDASVWRALLNGCHIHQKEDNG